MAIDVIFFESEDGQWICQGLTLDYCVSGATEDEARLNFWRGLAHTFYENQQRFGNCERICRPLTPEVWAQIEKRIRQPQEAPHE